MGSLFHFSIKQLFITAWEQTKLLFEQLKSIASSLEDNTFVVIVTDQFDHSGKHIEFSDFLSVLYNNISLLGNTHKNLRFYKNEVESLIYDKEVLARVTYEHLLLFKFDGVRLTMLPTMEAKTEEGEVLFINYNPERILPQVQIPSVVWQHITKK
ncbi:MAG: hypothetical protein CV087_18840 [Candidatus Brocadia sp. WS118]|nr:MAG: hypothetical protein CV087_18840 [Candidatus Brocadia sp. WS118]